MSAYCLSYYLAKLFFVNMVSLVKDMLLALINFLKAGLFVPKIVGKV